MSRTSQKNSLHSSVLVLTALFMSSCSPNPAPAATPSHDLQLPFELRQFDPSVSFFHGAPYPDEVVSIQDSDLQSLSCSPEYFSWSGTNHEYVDPATSAKYPLNDPQILLYLDSAVRLFPDRTVVSISLCETVDGPDIAIFRAGPCGGGCAGIPHVAYGQPDGELTLIGEIPPDGDGPYYGCNVLELTDGRQLYLSCLGEGTAIIRRLDLSNGDISIVLRCEERPNNASCES